MVSIFRYIMLFFFYSAAGWMVESTYCSIGEKRIINRGFLTGPMCPIYGTGALVMTIFLYKPFYERPLLVFLLGIILCDIVEYITSFLMETLFHARWWDYTYEFLNIKGRICLKHSLYWGVASVSFVYVIHPHIDNILCKISDRLVIYITAAILAVFALDVIHSFIKALDIRNLQIKLSGVLDRFSNGISSVKSSLEKTIEKGSDKISNAKNESLEQIQELIDQFELRFSKRGKKVNKNKYSSRYFRNNLEIERTARKQIEKLKNLADSIKADLFENEEKQ